MLEEIARRILSSRKTVAFTGAGISQASGIPAFRGGEGIWEKYNPFFYASLPGIILTFLLRPSSLASFFREIVESILKALPNPTHLVLADWEKRGIISSVITQNIDNLHQKAGSQQVIELHGNIYTLRCGKCLKRRKLKEEDLEEIVNILREGTRHSLMEVYRRLSPSCECGGKYRIHVVFFGESLPWEDFKKAEEEMLSSEVILLLGTSGMVEPARSLPLKARRGSVLIEINPSPTFYTPLVDYYLEGKAEIILPEMNKCLSN